MSKRVERRPQGQPVKNHTPQVWLETAAKKAPSVICGGQKRIKGQLQHPGKIRQFNVGDKPLSGFNALDGVFVNIKPGKLQKVRQFPLGFSHFFAALFDHSTAEVVPPIW